MRSLALDRLRPEAIALAYLVLWIPNIALTRLVTVKGGLTGLEVLPVLTCLTTLAMWSLIALSGWWRAAHTVRLARLRIPVPTSWRLVSALAATLLALSTPLSFTFPGVSIPFIQLLMKAGVLLIAPAVDLASGRRVHWYSWVALLLAGSGLLIALRARGTFDLPPLCLLVIAMYLGGYFVRLTAMSKAAKTDDPRTLKRYFVEEQVAAWPFAIVAGSALLAFGRGSAFDQLRWGAAHLWTAPVLPVLVGIAALTTLLGALSLVILLNARENTFCVPLERSASVLGGVAAAYVLAVLYALPSPTPAELTGAAFLVAAMVVLSLGPRLSRRSLFRRAIS
jgi:hypothetical protein